MSISKEIEPEHTKEHWVKFFKDQYNATGIKITKLECDWKFLTPTFSDRKNRTHFRDTAESGGGRAGMVIQYALGCPKCGRWFANGWYQTDCWCGEKIPSEFVYP